MTDTRTRILDVAEGCFSEKGFDGTSLREITRRAEVNLGAVNYHFGTKSGLFYEIIRRRVEPLNTERLRRLEETLARHAPEPAPLEEILDAFIRPAVETLDSPGGRSMLALLRQIQEARFAPGQFRELFIEVFQRFSVMRATLPELDDLEFLARLRMFIGGMLHLLGDRNWPGGELNRDQLMALLVTWAAAGMRAPATRLPGNPDPSTFLHPEGSS